jgi:FeS assembly SUF system protein
MSEIEAEVVEAIRKVYDPEIPVNVYDFGLIYEVAVATDGKASVRMTLTSPNCPVAESLPVEVQDAAETVDGVTEAEVEVVWEPPWTPESMTEAAKLELGFF